ncbi:unnamed protein product [Paramecium primaurelia]|uniref:Calcium-dependent protein kinase 1 n=1 Tax=Paramecium primaurelia TaxID=5886 RepID=A0A8S1N4J1_PARPR|nr:unnamed protein product [Paramecium primaurelia]
MGNTCCSNQPIDPEKQIDERPEDPGKKTDQEPKNVEEPNNQIIQYPTLSVQPSLFIQMKRETIYSTYQVGKLLGEGAYGQVSIVTHRVTGMQRAMKAIRKDCLFEEEQAKLFSEMTILKNLNHPHIVNLFELYEDEKFYYLITEYLRGGELFDRIQKAKSFSEADAVRYMKQVISAVAYCHSNNIVHRDLKPENIIFASEDQYSTLKVIDFGTSRKFDKNQNMSKRLGTPYYIAPEVLQKKYNEKCDVWSCGVILYILLAGYPPFYGRNETEIFDKILKGKIPFHTTEWNKISKEAKNLITNMLCQDVEKRYSAQQVLDDPWMQQGQEQNLFDDNFLKNLTEFSAKSKLKQALLTFMASQMIQPKEVEQIQEFFKQLDKNNDGKLSKEELVAAFQQKVQSKDRLIENMETKINKIVTEIDVNQSGYIDYTEFIMACLKYEKLLTIDKIKQTFRIFDLDGDKYISKEELSQIMEGVDDDIWKQFLTECDQDNDGKISEEEFINLLQDKF